MHGVCVYPVARHLNDVVIIGPGSCMFSHDGTPIDVVPLLVDTRTLGSLPRLLIVTMILLLSELGATSATKSLTGSRKYMR